MSAATLTRPTAGPASKFNVTFPRLLRSEFIKLLTVRSTIWSMSVAAVLLIGFAIIMAFASKSEDVFGTIGVPIGAMAPVVGVYFSQLVFVVLGVIGIGSEYSTGMIRSTLSAAPARVPALLAKTAVLGVAAFLVSFASVLVAFASVQAILSSTTLGASLGDPHVLRMLVGAALYLAFMTMFSLAIGAIVRNTAAGISIVVGLLLILPTFLPLIPWNALKEIVKYLPGVGDSVFNPPDFSTHSTWVGFAVLVVWTVVATAVAAVLIKRRDA